jgi:hypothetical protein
MQQYGTPWSQGLMHSPYAGAGLGQQSQFTGAQGFGQPPFGQYGLPQQGSPWTGVGRPGGLPYYGQSF